MTKQELRKKILSYKWEVWIDRPFGAFFVSLAQGGNSRLFMRKVGVDIELPASLFQNSYWYQSEEVWEIFSKDLEKYLRKGGNVFDIVRLCENHLKIGREKISVITKSSADLKICMIF